MTVADCSLKQVLGWLILGTRGGRTRAQIIRTIEERPQNANQLAHRLGRDYKTIKFHLKALEKRRIVVPVGGEYGTAYFLSETVENNYDVFEEIESRLFARNFRNPLPKNVK